MRGASPRSGSSLFSFGATVLILHVPRFACWGNGRDVLSAGRVCGVASSRVRSASASDSVPLSLSLSLSSVSGGAGHVEASSLLQAAVVSRRNVAASVLFTAVESSLRNAGSSGAHLTRPAMPTVPGQSCVQRQRR